MYDFANSDFFTEFSSLLSDEKLRFVLAPGDTPASRGDFRIFVKQFFDKIFVKEFYDKIFSAEKHIYVCNLLKVIIFV